MWVCCCLYLLVSFYFSFRNKYFSFFYFYHQRGETHEHCRGEEAFFLKQHVKDGRQACRVTQICCHALHQLTAPQYQFVSLCFFFLLFFNFHWNYFSSYSSFSIFFIFCLERLYNFLALFSSLPRLSFLPDVYNIYCDDDLQIIQHTTHSISSLSLCWGRTEEKTFISTISKVNFSFYFTFSVFLFFFPFLIDLTFPFLFHLKTFFFRVICTSSKSKFPLHFTHEIYSPFLCKKSLFLQAAKKIIRTRWIHWKNPSFVVFFPAKSNELCIT